jgi:hypothetical protein
MCVSNHLQLGPFFNYRKEERRASTCTRLLLTLPMYYTPGSTPVIIYVYLSSLFCIGFCCALKVLARRKRKCIMASPLLSGFSSLATIVRKYSVVDRGILFFFTQTFYICGENIGKGF